jgi:hypothetical protein
LFFAQPFNDFSLESNLSGPGIDSWRNPMDFWLMRQKEQGEAPKFLPVGL